MDINHGKLALGDESSGEWSLESRSNSSKFQSDPFAYQGTFDIEVSDVKPLLPLVAPDLPAKVSGLLLGLGELDARVTLFLGSGLKRVEVLHASSDPLELEGHWQNDGGDTRAAFLLRTGVLNFGFELNGDQLDVTPGASEKLLR